jgi:hypothetical protein
MEILHKMQIGQVYCKDIFKGNPTKFILFLWSFNLFSMYFGNLKEFLEI